MNINMRIGIDIDGVLTDEHRILQIMEQNILLKIIFNIYYIKTFMIVKKYLK